MKLASPRPSRERISQSPHASFPNPNFRPHTAEVAINASLTGHLGSSSIRYESKSLIGGPFNK